MRRRRKSADRTLKNDGGRISTGIPSVLAAASVMTVMVTAAPFIIDGRTERDGNGVGIFCPVPFLADFHVDRDICCRAPGKEGGDRASFQTLENQRERVLADAPVYEDRVGLRK